MPKKKSRLVPKNDELALQANDRAALRNEQVVEALSDKTPGELEAGAMDNVRDALVADVAPELKENL